VERKEQFGEPGIPGLRLGPFSLQPIGSTLNLRSKFPSLAEN